jgi:hypothetical protein
LEFLRNVDEHLDIGRVTAEIGDLGEGGALDEFVVCPDGCTLHRGADGH